MAGFIEGDTPGVTIFTLTEMLESERSYDHLKLEAKNGVNLSYNLVACLKFDSVNSKSHCYIITLCFRSWCHFSHLICYKTLLTLPNQCVLMSCFFLTSSMSVY